MSVLSVAAAYASSDGWYKYPLISETIDDVVETSDKVYYTSGGSLFSYSTSDDEAYAYSDLNKLSGTTVTLITYNYDSKYLVVAYDDGNLDVLYDNGRVVNLPDIRDAQINYTKTINHVAFGDGYIVVSTKFGIVIYREDKMEVVQSGIYGNNINGSAIRNGRLVLYCNVGDGKGHTLRWAPITERLNSLDKFTYICGFYVTDLKFIDDNTIVGVNLTNYKVYMRTIDFDTNKSSSVSYDTALATSRLYPYADGYYCYSDSTLSLVTGTDTPQTIDLPNALKGQKLAFRDSYTKLWAGDENGLAQYDISSSTPTVLYDKMIYPDAITVAPVGFMRWSADGQRLYISNITLSIFKSFAETKDFVDEYQKTNIIENGSTRDVSLMNASADQSNSINYQTNNGNTRMYGDPAWMIEDPDDPNIYYLANNHEGLYAIKYNASSGEYEEIQKFTEENSPMTYNYGYRCQDVNIDPAGNLWIGYQYDSHYSILPAAKRRQGMESITTSDWIEHTKLASAVLDQKDMMSLFCKKSNMMFTFTGLFGGGLVAVDTKGTYDDPTDDTMLQWSTFIDQDGNQFSAPDRITFAIEDNRGCVWIGTSAGVFEITTPSNATNTAMTVRRIKVPRNDGTNYADYLLESDIILWMAEDAANRKWIATENSGLFLVSETGDEIIRNYTTDNSPLPSNVICSVECDPYSNMVYVGTPYGLYTFLSDAAPAQEDYSEICAYPNPVRPEYYGDVTITGLMENTIVKIADVAGNVVAHLRSEGGMATWDVCNLSGKRVKSGVYYVFATSNDGSSSSGAVTKILVIN